MNIKQAIYMSREFNLDKIGARRVLSYILDKSDIYLIINADEELNKKDEDKYLNAMQKIRDGYPLQYITHSQGFYGLDFYVDKNVLIPQPDTEVLVEQALKILKKRKGAKVLDLCTGSGAIAIALKNTLKEKIEMYASDISKDAINVARKNCINILGNEEEINFIESDMFDNIKDKFDVIVSNPPYIRSKKIKSLAKDVQNEPHLALDGGEDGLQFYKNIKKDGIKHLNDNGYLLMEIGYDQKDDLLKMFKEGKCVKDYQKLDRVIIWHKE